MRNSCNYRVSDYRQGDLQNMIIPSKYQKYLKSCQVENNQAAAVTPEGSIRTSGWSHKEADLGSA